MKWNYITKGTYVPLILTFFKFILNSKHFINLNQILTFIEITNNTKIKFHKAKKNSITKPNFANIF